MTFCPAVAQNLCWEMHREYQFIRKEARQFTKKLRYGVLTMVEFLS